MSTFLRRLGSKRFSPLLLAFCCALFLLAFANFSFWHGSFRALHQEPGTTLSLIILALALLALYTGVIYLLLWRGLGKPLLIALFLFASLAAYAMDAYGTHIDANMVGNAILTNWRELHDLLSWELLAYVLLLGVLPSLLVLLVPLRYPGWRRQLLNKPGVLLLSLALAALLLFSNYQQMSAFGRNHRDLRYLINPWLPLNYTLAYFHHAHASHEPFVKIGQDARIGAPLAHAHKPTLIFLVVGETARAQDFSLDGYARDTNPELAKRNVISFQHAESCGTETAVSVPCMFSPFGRKHYSKDRALHTSNLLDVLTRAGVSVLWRDNNSGDQGMAARVTYEDVSHTQDPANCMADHEHCFDTVMLDQLPDWLKKHKGNLLVVMHMYGSHGPAYYLRYPPAFARFQPECKTNELSKCDSASIVNSYDNSILFTDHVLAGMIDFLKQQAHYNTALLYLSDHGESLGEYGIYLHGMPYAIAPIQQRHIPFIWWMSKGYAKTTSLSHDCLAARVNEPVSQDNLFASVLGLFAVKTSVYQPQNDIFAPCR